jgi:hypothetical protein
MTLLTAGIAMLRSGRNLSPTFQVQTVMNQITTFFALEHLTVLLRSLIFVVILVGEEWRCWEGEKGRTKECRLEYSLNLFPLNLKRNDWIPGPYPLPVLETFTCPWLSRLYCGTHFHCVGKDTGTVRWSKEINFGVYLSTLFLSLS